jgi:hypothetical protein
MNREVEKTIFAILFLSSDFLVFLLRQFEKRKMINSMTTFIGVNVTLIGDRKMSLSC